ncbi:MAG: lipopolysaccharide biosynthesis protein [Bryobacteraceae bacterium]
MPLELAEPGTQAKPPAPLSRSKRSVRFAHKAALAISDQALFSGANFAVNILLARWLAPAEYGAFSLAYSVFLLFAVVHTALLIEPLMVFGSGKYQGVFPSYVRVLLRGHFALMAPGIVLLFITAFVLGKIYSPTAERAFFGLALSGAAILLFWLVRRVFYVLLQPGWGVLGGALYFSTVMGCMWGLRAVGQLSTTTAFVAMGAASLLASLILFARFGFGWSEASEPSFREVAADHWRYGRWAIASSAVSWFPGSIYYALLPAWQGLEATAALRALMNFVMPVLQAIAALGMLLVPMLVRDRDSGGFHKMNRTMLLFLGLFCSGAVVYGLALWLLRGHIFQLFYAGKYGQYAGLPFLLAGLLPLGTCATAVLGDGLRALERPDRTFWCYLGSVGSAMVAGIPLARVFGVTGALIGLHLSSIVTASMMGWFYFRLRRAA